MKAFEVQTPIGILCVIPRVYESGKNDQIHVYTEYQKDVIIRNIPYSVSMTFAKELIEDDNGAMPRKHCTDNYNRRRDKILSDHPTELASKKIREACEIAFDKFMSEVGEKGFVLARKEMLEHRMDSLASKIEEMEKEKQELMAKHQKICEELYFSFPEEEKK